MRYSLLFLFLFACGSDYTPKPRAFFKIKFPQKEYQTFSDNQLAFTFLYPKYSKVEIEKNINFLNINFPQFSGKLYLTYVNLNNDLNEHIEQSRSLAYKHNDQADVISEQVFVNEENNILECFMIIKVLQVKLMKLELLCQIMQNTFGELN